jgi:hypothetical protein
MVIFDAGIQALAVRSQLHTASLAARYT